MWFSKSLKLKNEFLFLRRQKQSVNNNKAKYLKLIEKGFNILFLVFQIGNFFFFVVDYYLTLSMEEMQKIYGFF